MNPAVCVLCKYWNYVFFLHEIGKKWRIENGSGSYERGGMKEEMKER